MRPYREKDKVTPEQASALVYAWWITAPPLLEGDEWILDYLSGGTMEEFRSSRLTNILDVAQHVNATWSPSMGSLRSRWRQYTKISAFCPRSLLYITILKEFMNETPTRKDAAKKARRKNVVRRKAPRRVEKNKGA